MTMQKVAIHLCATDFGTAYADVPAQVVALGPAAVEVYLDHECEDWTHIDDWEPDSTEVTSMWLVEANGSEDREIS